MSDEAQAQAILHWYTGGPHPLDAKHDENCQGCRLERAEQRAERYEKALREVKSELGVPSDDYPANVANAYDIAADALGEGGALEAEVKA